MEAHAMSDETDPPQALLDTANDCHDDDPPRAAGLLRRIDPAALPADRLPVLAFLLNHVLGEKFGAWDEAHARFGPVLRAAGAQPLPVLWRQAAAAAGLAGDAAAAADAITALAQATGASAEQAGDVVALTQAMFRVPGLPAASAAQAAAAAIAALAAPRWQAQATPLDEAAGACTNNIASSLIERPPTDLADPALRAVTEDVAQCAERLWLRAGTWVNHERAAYLRALVANGLGDPGAAREHALRALALIDANDTEHAEDVDRAFLLLEQSRAARALGRADEAQATLAHADALAAKFGDAGLDAWYADRRAVSVPHGRSEGTDCPLGGRERSELGGSRSVGEGSA
jgi:hypothetical protein